MLKMQGCFDCGWVSVSGCWCVAKVPTLQNVLALASFDFIVVSRTHANMDQTSKKKKKSFFSGAVLLHTSRHDTPRDECPT